MIGQKQLEYPTIFSEMQIFIAVLQLAH